MLIRKYTFFNQIALCARGEPIQLKRIMCKIILFLDHVFATGLATCKICKKSCCIRPCPLCNIQINKMKVYYVWFGCRLRYLINYDELRRIKTESQKKKKREKEKDKKREIWNDKKTEREKEGMTKRQNDKKTERQKKALPIF